MANSRSASDPPSPPPACDQLIGWLTFVFCVHVLLTTGFLCRHPELVQRVQLRDVRTDLGPHPPGRAAHRGRAHQDAAGALLQRTPPGQYCSLLAVFLCPLKVSSYKSRPRLISRHVTDSSARAFTDIMQSTHCDVVPG